VPSDLVVSSSSDAGITTIGAVGEIDYGNADDVGRSVESALAEGCAALRIDLSGVRYADSVALAALLRAREACLAAGVTFAVVSPSHAMSELLTMTGLDRILCEPS
jgi:anti-anti-sigma factor